MQICHQVKLLVQSEFHQFLSGNSGQVTVDQCNQQKNLTPFQRQNLGPNYPWRFVEEVRDLRKINSVFKRGIIQCQ